LSEAAARLAGSATDNRKLRPVILYGERSVFNYKTAAARLRFGSAAHLAELFIFLKKEEA